MKRSILFAALCLVAPSLGAKEFHVAPNPSSEGNGAPDAPFGTLVQARNAVRAYLQSGKDLDKDIEVIVHDGRYDLSKTLVLNLSDSAPPGVSIHYRAQNPGKAIIAAGKPIRAWKKLKDDPPETAASARGKLWIADVSKLMAQGLRFRSLYDGEERLDRARAKGFVPTSECPSPSLAHRWEDLHTLNFPEGTLKNWENLDDVELVIRPTQQWLINYLPLKSVDMEKRIAKTAVAGTYRLDRVVRKKWEETAWIENTLEGLDEPGEWALNSRKGLLYYWPKQERPSKNITAPGLRELIRIEGNNNEALTGDVPVKGIHLDGLVFTGGDRDVWTKQDKGIQHDWDMYDKGNAMLRFRGAENCRVTRCQFRNAGSSGLRIDLYGQGIHVENCEFGHLGGVGILLCGYGPGLKDVNRGHVIKNCEIHHIGEMWYHSPAIFIWQSGDNVITNNYVHDLPYDAVVISGVRPRYFEIYDPVKWKGYIIPKTIRENMQVIRHDEVGKPTQAHEVLKFAHARNNLIRDNEFHNVMEMLGDGNAIYLSCGGANNQIQSNFIYRSTKAPNEIRFDDDQEYSQVSENIILGNGIKLKHTNYIENNVIIGNGISIRPETARGATIKRNIVISTLKAPNFYNTNKATLTLHQLMGLARPDYNIFYSSEETKGLAYFKKIKSWGQDKNSVFGKPGFVDAKKGDFRLAPNSLARSLGIESIDVDRIGLEHEPTFQRLRKEGFDFLENPLIKKPH